MSTTELKNHSNSQQILLEMHNHQEDPDQPNSTVGNIRLITRNTTIGEVTFRIHQEEMVIDELFIKPPFRRQGFGTRLIQLAEKIAAETHLKQISLNPSPIDTVNLETLKRWYSQRGYTPSRNLMRKSTATLNIS